MQERMPFSAFFLITLVFNVLFGGVAVACTNLTDIVQFFVACFGLFTYFVCPGLFETGPLDMNVEQKGAV